MKRVLLPYCLNCIHTLPEYFIYRIFNHIESNSFLHVKLRPASSNAESSVPILTSRVPKGFVRETPYSMSRGKPIDAVLIWSVSGSSCTYNNCVRSYQNDKITLYLTPHSCVRCTCLFRIYTQRCRVSWGSRNDLRSPSSIRPPLHLEVRHGDLLRKERNKRLTWLIHFEEKKSRL